MIIHIVNFCIRIVFEFQPLDEDLILFMAVQGIPV